MARQRPLTAGEIALARAAFADGVDYSRVRLSDGPGLQPLAHIAFAKGNPAITVGKAIYFKTGYCPDFSAGGADRRGFIHEMTHVWQYRRLGLPAFAARYGADFLHVGGRADDMYRYVHGKAPFADAMIEAQAEMVADYSVALWNGDPAALATFGRNLERSGLYGL
jgi:Domain of unknown function (DUF4157)